MIGQLEFEGYSTEDATSVVDALNVDWKEQAAKATRDYLDLMPFSRSGLIEQLEFEGYSREQAQYGVTQAGLSEAEMCGNVHPRNRLRWPSRPPCRWVVHRSRLRYNSLDEVTTSTIMH